MNETIICLSREGLKKAGEFLNKVTIILFVMCLVFGVLVWLLKRKENKK